MSLLTKFLDNPISYSGKELRPHWVAEKLQKFGSGVVAFVGDCDVPTAEMVDQEDSFQGNHIRSKQMLHFLGEWFEGDLHSAILRQRLWIADFKDVLQSKLNSSLQDKIIRRGNDLYILSAGKEKKLSVSIVTASPVSTLFHFGVNIDASGAPVSAIGLNEISVNPKELALEMLQRWSLEWDSIIKARAKVSPR